MIQFYFNFVTSGHGRRQSDEFIGFDAVGFSLKQDEDRKGRDTVSAGSSDAKYRVTDKINGHLDLLLLNFEMEGHQADVKVEIFYNEQYTTIGNVDFHTCDTDWLTFFEFTVIQDSSESKLKTNFDTPVDLFSSLTLDNQNIQAVTKHRLFRKAKPYLKQSVWNNEGNLEPVFAQGRSTAPGFFNTIKNLTSYDVSESLTWLYDYTGTPTGSPNNYPSPPQEFQVLRAINNLKGLKAKLQLDITSESTNMNIFSPMRIVGRFFKGTFGESFEDFRRNSTTAAGAIVFYDTGTALNTFPGSYSVNTTLNIDLPDLDRGQCLYFIFSHQAELPTSFSKTTIRTSKLTITASEVAYSSVIDVVRYIDAIKYAVKSTSGLNVVAPRFEFGGEFYETYITNAQLMRGLTRPFTVSPKDLFDKDIRPSINGDYQMRSNSDVFVGKYEDFYMPAEIGRFTGGIVNEAFRKNTNNRTACKAVSVTYENYASQKEGDTGATLDIVHGQSQNYIPSIQSDGTLDVSIGFICDAFLIEDMGQKAFNLQDNAATQDDEKVVKIDAVPFTTGRQISETSLLQHRQLNTQLELKNDLSFSWVQLGIGFNEIFTIRNGVNAGQFTIGSMTDQTLVLYRVNQSQVIQDILEFNTQYTYIVDRSIQLTMRTNEGFETITNLSDGENFANLQWTCARILHRYYKQELAAITDKPIKNQKYLYNKDCTTKFTGEPTIREGADLIPENPILTRFQFSTELEVSLQEYFDLVQRVKDECGYITTLDSRGLLISGYPSTEMSWTPKYYGAEELEDFTGTMAITCEELYRQFQVVIIAIGRRVSINDTIQPAGFNYTIDELGYVTLYDSIWKQLYPAVLFDRIQVNTSGSAETPEQLGSWLSEFANN